MYKIIQNNKVIDIVKNPRFVRILSSGYIAITDKTSANGIVGSNNQTIYSFVPTERKDISVAIIEEITLEEFNRLQNLLNSKMAISADALLLEQTKQNALTQLSTFCKEAITAGFSITLSDGELYNFKLTQEDQINLLNIENQLNAGAKTVIYHATDLPCRIFTCADMTKIIKAYRSHVQYHTTYFNIAKQYLKSLTDIDKIKAFTYGTDISDKAKDPTLRYILKKGGSSR